MDARLQLVNGRRLSRLRQEDLPNVAKVIVGYERRVVRSERCFSKQVVYYRFRGKGLTVIVLGTDFEKILPYIKDGSFDPIQFPAPTIDTSNPDLDPDVSTIDQWDPVFYTRVLGQLRALFPDSYPTSNL